MPARFLRRPMQAERQRSKPRIQTLSDLIFGLALSIGALTLVGEPPATSQGFLTSIALYAMSFLILASVWMTYARIMDALPMETNLLTNANIVLLFAVSIEPYVFREVMVTGGDLWITASVVYSLDLMAMFGINSLFYNSLAKQEEGVGASKRAAMFRKDRNYAIFEAGILLASCLPVFGFFFILPSGALFPPRAIVWTAVLVLGWVRRHARRDA